MNKLELGESIKVDICRDGKKVFTVNLKLISISAAIPEEFNGQSEISIIPEFDILDAKGQLLGSTHTYDVRMRDLLNKY